MPQTTSWTDGRMKDECHYYTDFDSNYLCFNHFFFIFPMINVKLRYFWLHTHIFMELSSYMSHKYWSLTVPSDSIFHYVGPVLTYNTIMFFLYEFLFFFFLFIFYSFFSHLHLIQLKISSPSYWSEDPFMKLQFCSKNYHLVPCEVNHNYPIY